MIQLPDLFERKLDNHPELASAVRKNLDSFGPWLEQSGMPFFPGYTDHSTRHINAVLKSAASLVSDTAHDLLGAEDIAVLTLATLVHDCGMHLTQDVFRVLVSSDEPAAISGFGDQPWKKTWRDFLSEARRFGQEKLIAIFGDAEPYLIEDLDLANLSERDCYLIGEFIRRHHARIGHEIARSGLPQVNSRTLELTGVEENFRDMSGLVARSHGMPIRNTFGYIHTNFGLLPECQKVKIPFLMAVLRISDYIQVNSERALKSLLSVKELRSPVSRQEWRNHFAVRDVSMRHNDPEALYVRAVPTDVRTYLKLDSLFRDIQRELDESWATIGEVYGRQEELSKLGLTVRRIRSNLDDKEFSATVPYLPIKAGFDTSGPDLLKLLVGPLYGYDFSVGIRELLQNALDACKELCDLNTNGTGEGAGIDPSVTVEITEADDGTGWITVSDTGVGMTVETVTRYFLIAGASFRNSDVWKRQHTDDSGVARVLRGGRFGVGALAAFLLGDEILVKTRHIRRANSDGIEFKARIDEPIIELRRCTAANGTEIKIWVSDPEVLDALRPTVYPSRAAAISDELQLDDWEEVDWFRQARPKVIFRWDGFSHGEPETRVRYRGTFSPDGKHLVPQLGRPDDDWKPIPDSRPYQAIYWRYSGNDLPDEELEAAPLRYYYYRPQEITVNGIRVGDVHYSSDDGKLAIDSEDARGCPYVSVLRPSMAIFDAAGVCPINLQRSSIAFERMNVDALLAKQILELHFATIRRLVEAGDDSLATFDAVSKRIVRDVGILYKGQVAPLMVTRKGIALLSTSVLQRLGVKTLYLGDLGDEFQETNSPSISQAIKKEEALILRRQRKGVQDDLSWFRAIFGSPSGRWQCRELGVPHIDRTWSASVMLRERWTLASRKGNVRRQILDPLVVSVQGKNHNYVGSSPTVPPTLEKRLKDILRLLGPKTAELACWHDLILPTANEVPSLTEEAWIEAVGSDVIAFR